MEIRGYLPGDEEKILQLFELVYGQQMSKDQWNWRFKDNPAGKHFIKLMWDGKRLVGHYAVSPIWAKVGGREVFATHSLTTMTHPAYGRRGIFKSLALELYNELESTKNVELIWGFPNNNSHYGFIKNLDWNDAGIIHTLSANAQLFSPQLLPEVKELPEFSHQHADLFSDLIISKVHLVKSVEYLNWRYYAKPSVDYKVFELKDARGVMVTKLYPSSEGAWIMNIVELILRDWTDLKAIIEHALACYEERIEKVTIWKNLKDKNYGALEKLRFVPTAPLTYLGFRASGTIREFASHLSNWDYSMGDSDVF